ncbi:MAG: HvfX family Cu-binding RiPP maturation protein [Methylophilaceae bacterium]
MKCAILCKSYHWAISLLESIGTWFPQLILRFILAWEFGEAGFEKLHGTNWFSNITFPFPFNLVPPEFSWHLSTIFEIVGAFALILGLATRFFSASLIVLTIVAIAAVHWPESWSTLAELWKGYAITDKGYGNFKLPLLLLIMLLPLLFNGAGKLSLDHLINTKKWWK